MEVLEKGHFCGSHCSAAVNPWTNEWFRQSGSLLLLPNGSKNSIKKTPAAHENSSLRRLINLIFHSVFSLWLALRISTLIYTSSWAAIRKKGWGGDHRHWFNTMGRREQEAESTRAVKKIALEDRTTDVCACSALVRIRSGGVTTLKEHNRLLKVGTVPAAVIDTFLMRKMRQSGE